MSKACDSDTLDAVWAVFSISWNCEVTARRTSHLGHGVVDTQLLYVLGQGVGHLHEAVQVRHLSSRPALLL